MLAEIEKTGIKHVILLSGRNLGDTIDLLQAHPQIGLALCGGDYTGRIFSVQTSRMDLADGRSVLMLNDNVDYFRLDLIVDDTIRVKAFAQKQTTAKPTEEAVYLAFKNRLSLWKEKFIEDEVKLISDLNAVESKIDDVRFAQLLRDRFDCEIAVVETDTIKPLSLNQDIKSSDFLSMVNRDYFVFLFTLTGDELNRVLEQKKGPGDHGRQSYEGHRAGVPDCRHPAVSGGRHAARHAADPPEAAQVVSRYQYLDDGDGFVEGRP
ncbi:hypothetical protein [Desulfosarcina cetonica]|uniref:hypothetical protein n=1 Tax=Desulfosarcina cetonica TaxID=90730 RepID=UPI0012EDB63B|nr:hypothetical protein [Desulfosarcina cetonica]